MRNRLDCGRANLDIGNERGFSLIEMMIVISIMALLGTFIVTNVMRRFDEAKLGVVKTQIRALSTSLQDFKRVCGFYPTSEDGLEALISPPKSRECKSYGPEGFITDKKIPLDPWNNQYYYTSDGKTFLITSYGADGKPGGDGMDKDITSDDLGD